MAFLEDSHLLDDRQFCFRKKKSTLDALNYIKNYIDDEVNKKNIVCIISLDIKNAFNSIHRKDILEIMDNYKVPWRLKLVIADYLNNRKILISENEYLDFNVGEP